MSAFRLPASGIAVVTGGTRGIGRAIADMFMEAEGCTGIAVIGRHADRLNDTVTSMRSMSRHGVSIEGVQCDVADSKAVDEAFNEAERILNGQLSVLVNAAGVNKDGLLARCSDDDINVQISTNLLGTMYASRWAVRHFLRRRTKGSILSIGSIVGSSGGAGQVPYSASKSGLEGFTRSLALEVASRDIRVNLLSPGYIDTDMTRSSFPLSSDWAEVESRIPMKRVGSPHEVAEAARLLISCQYITGHNLVVSGGLL